MKILKNNVFEVGARHPDRKLFDELIPLPNGTSYNSYLIVASEKTALIDTVDPSKKDVLLENIAKHNITNIDYIIANHAEQDHSGSIPFVLEKFPKAKVVTNQKCKEMLISLLHISPEKFYVVNDNDELSLGDKTLKFILTPWVHWPETMCTYLKQDNILFTCDFFGSHDANFELFSEDEKKTEKSAKRYYAEIMMPFRTAIKGNIAKVEALNVEIIAPSHGPVYKNPSFIINLYKDWISEKVNKNVIIAYVSMHESTKIMAEYIAKKLHEKKINVVLVNLTDADIGEIAIALVDSGCVIFGSPCFLSGLHPVMQNVLFLFNALRPKTKVVSFFGSFSWATKTPENFKSAISNIHADVVEPVVVKGLSVKEDLLMLDNYADEIAKKVNNLN